LLNQSPFVTQANVQAAYGLRWIQFSAAVRTMDPTGRMFMGRPRRFSRFALSAPNSIDNHAPMQDTSGSIGLHFPEFAISAFKPADRIDSSNQFPSPLSFLSFDVFHPS
jgi:hypothetical protein